MTLIKLPTTGLRLPLCCAICLNRLTTQTGTAGLIDSNNRQAFACISHFSEIELLLTGWADFLWSERQKYRKPEIQPNQLIYEGMSYAWPNS